MSCPLLQLPGEIRNRIYEFVATEELPVLVKHDARNGGTYAALTRVCRDIRKEYLPIQQCNARVKVESDDLVPFMDTILHGNMKQLVATTTELRCTSMFGYFIDIMPVLRTMVRYPDFTFSVESHYGFGPRLHHCSLHSALDIIREISHENTYQVANLSVDLETMLMLIELNSAHTDSEVNALSEKIGASSHGGCDIWVDIDEKDV